MFKNCIINEKWLKEFSPYPLNYNMKEVENYVKLSELQYVLPLIGYDLYDELVQQVADNDVSDENATALVEALWPLLGFAVAYEALPLTWASVSEIGVVKGHSDNSESLTLKDLTLVQQHLKGQLNVRLDYAKQWLCQHADSFPKLDRCKCGCIQCNQGVANTKRDIELYTTYRRNTNLR